MLVAIVCIIYIVLLFGFSALAQKKQNDAIAKGGKGSFLMAGKNLPLILIAVLIAGGTIGGSLTTGIAQQVQTAGISGCWYGLASFCGLLFLAFVGAKRIRRMGYSTNSEMVADYCGPLARFLMVIGQLIIILGVACLQYVTGGALLASMFPDVISSNMGILITAAAFALVCIFGGLMGTSIANLVNMVVIYLGLFICGIVAIIYFGGWETLMSGMAVVEATESTVSGGSWMSFTGGLGLATCLSYLVSEPGNRITTQTNTMAAHAAKNEKSARWGIALGACLCLPVLVMSVIIGLIAKVNFPDVESAQAMATVIMALPAGCAALGMAGLWAVTISTGVTLLISSAQVVVLDIVAPVRKKMNKKEMTQKNEKFYTRVVIVILAVLTLFMAYKAVSIVSTLITVLCITPAFFWMMISFLYCPKLLKKSSAIITQIAAYLFFFAWLFIPAVKTMFPTPIYVEWPMCTVIWFACAIFDKRSVGEVVPKSQRASIKEAE